MTGCRALVVPEAKLGGGHDHVNSELHQPIASMIRRPMSRSLVVTIPCSTICAAAPWAWAASSSRARLAPRVTVPVPLMKAIAEACPPDDRTAERRVFPGFSPDTARSVVARACKAGRIPHFHPHDFRHRYASVKIAEGVPVTQLAAQLGHAKNSLTLDVYGHVLTR